MDTKKKESMQQKSAKSHDVDSERSDKSARKPNADTYTMNDVRKAQKKTPYLQNRELSWLTFNERVLDQGSDPSVPLLERLNFVSIFWSNLQEFFMVRVGSLTDLVLVKKQFVDSKSHMTPTQQLEAIYERCHELYPVQERVFEEVRTALAKKGVSHLRPDDLNEEQRTFLLRFVEKNIKPFLSPQIINSRHPFPHLENGALYVAVRLNEEVDLGKKASEDKNGGKKKNRGADGVTLGLIPLPRQCDRVIPVPGEGFSFVLLEHAIEMVARDIFSMYEIKCTNIICVTRNADLDVNEGADEADDDYREHMKRILKKRSRLAPVRLESERPLSSMLEKMLLKKLHLKDYQVFVTSVPLDMSFTWGLAGSAPEETLAEMTNEPFAPQWPSCLDRNRSIIEQVSEKEVLLSYPYESMDAFVQLLREAASDPSVLSIKITLYRLASQSHLAEALIAAAEAGKEVTALFELRARFDESNNISWSQRFEQAGCKVIYGFRDFKVHSKICCITRHTGDGLQHITQLGTGNYNEKTAKLYTDLSFITTDETFGRDATEFFRNMALENTSDNYEILSVAPLQIKPSIIAGLDEQIALAQEGKASGAMFKTNSITDLDVIEKIVEASQAGVPVTLFVRGISCIVPGIKKFTENVRVVSIVGRLLEHSRIYCFGPRDNMQIYLSSADLMTRNMDKRIEIAWPILNEDLKQQVLDYLDVSMSDTAKLRELRPDKTYTALGAFALENEQGEIDPFDSQEYLIDLAQKLYEQAENKALPSSTMHQILSEENRVPFVLPPSNTEETTEDVQASETKAAAGKHAEIAPAMASAESCAPSDEKALEEETVETGSIVSEANESGIDETPGQVANEVVTTAVPEAASDEPAINEAEEPQTPFADSEATQEFYSSEAYLTAQALIDSKIEDWPEILGLNQTAATANKDENIESGVAEAAPIDGTTPADVEPDTSEPTSCSSAFSNKHVPPTDFSAAGQSSAVETTVDATPSQDVVADTSSAEQEPQQEPAPEAVALEADAIEPPLSEDDETAPTDSPQEDSSESIAEQIEALVPINNKKPNLLVRLLSFFVRKKK